MASSEQLERQAEATRASIDQTLTELRARISPQHIVDQAADYANQRMNGDVVGTVGRQIADNPIPFLLVGVGLAWLLASQRRKAVKARDRGVPEHQEIVPVSVADVAGTMPFPAVADVETTIPSAPPLVPSPVSRAETKEPVA